MSGHKLPSNQKEKRPGKSNTIYWRKMETLRRVALPNLGSLQPPWTNALRRTRNTENGGVRYLNTITIIEGGGSDKITKDYFNKNTKLVYRFIHK